MRIAVGGLMQESNSFASRAATLADFEAAGIHRAEDVVSALSGTNSEVGGFLATLGERGIEPVPLLAAQAISGGPLDAETYATLLDELLDRLRAAQRDGAVDGVLLALHGAMLAEGDDDPDGTTLARVRQVVGASVPVAASLDLHANVTAKMVGAAGALAGYNTYPHVDQASTGARAARALLDAIAGRPPAMAWRRLPMIVPAENMQTTSGPMASLYERASAFLRDGRARDVSLFGVQPWLDVPDLGCSVVVLADERAEAEAVATILAGELWERRRAFDVALTPVPEAVDRALRASGHPFVLADSADGPGSGSAGDSTTLLSNLVARGLDREEEGAGRLCLLTVVDPASAGAAGDAGVGARLRLEVGAALDPRFSRPVPLEAEVLWAGSGRFTFRGPSYTGTEALMGQTAVLGAGRLRVVVMEHAVSTIDPELYRSVGLEPTTAQVVVVKSPNMFRAAYGPLAHEIVMVDAPGASSANLSALPFKRRRRPLFPFEDDCVP